MQLPLVNQTIVNTLPQDMRWGDGLYQNEYGLKHQGQWERDQMHGFGKQVLSCPRLHCCSHLPLP
jgi:hypothetical protein